jgi:hypothetical protein
LSGVILYVLSAGPSAWVVGRCGFPDWLLIPYEVIYKPIDLAQEKLPESTMSPLNRYIGWWLAEFLPPAATPTAVASPPRLPAASPPTGAVETEDPESSP